MKKCLIVSLSVVLVLFFLFSGCKQGLGWLNPTAATQTPAGTATISPTVTVSPTITMTSTITPTFTATIAMRLQSVSQYLSGGSFNGIETYNYDVSNRLVTHIIKNGSNVETKRYEYEYGVDGKVNKLKCFVNNVLTVYSVPSYDVSGNVSGNNQYNGSDALLKSAVFTYDGSGHLTRKDLYNSSAVLSVIFLFTPTATGLYTTQDIKTASNVLINRITQEFNANDNMTNRRFYSSSLSLQANITFSETAGQKTDLWYYNSGGTLLLHGTYQFELGEANLDENHADLWEMVYIDTDTY